MLLVLFLFFLLFYFEISEKVCIFAVMKTMKVVWMTLAAVLCCAMTVKAEPVSPAVARQAAVKFLKGRGAVLQNEAMRAPHRAMGLKTEGNEATEASPYYVFNAKASQGFVVVSGDDCVGDNLVLGYTSRGSFDADRVPDNMQWWLDTMGSQIALLSRCGAKARAVALHDDVAPMVTARWNQGDNVYNPKNPYNAYCPKKDGMLSVTGCMATALAQVMYYHRWPQEPIADEVPAYYTVDGRLIEALPVTTFDWSHMIDDYRGDITNIAQQMAVAELMRYCGQSVQMDYGLQISYGYYYDVDLLVNVFGYEQGVYTAEAEKYSPSEWDELIYNELREGRPLAYCGKSTGGGHAFVIDGYEARDGSGYYSVNWGWGGDGNGFFKINLLNPYTSGTGGSTTMDGFSCCQQALIGLQPAKHAPEAYGRYLGGYQWNYEDNGVPHLFASVNTSYRPGDFDIALAERLDDGTADFSNPIAQQTLTIAGYAFAGFNSPDHTGLQELTLPEGFANGLAPGRHELVFIDKEAGTEAPWHVLFGPNCYIELMVGSDGVPTDTIFHPQPQLTLPEGGIEVEGLAQWGLALKVTATVGNNSDDDYIGQLMCLTCWVENDTLKVWTGFSQSGIMVEAHGTSTLPFYVSGPVPGNYIMVFSNGINDLTGTPLANIKQTKGYVGHKSFSVGELAFTQESLKYSGHTDDEGNTSYFFEAVVTNNTPLDYNAVLLAHISRYVEEEDTYRWDNGQYYTSLNLESGKQQTARITLPSPLEPGKYMVELLIANDFCSLMPSDYFVFSRNLFTIDSSTAIEAIEDGRSAADDNGGAWFTMDGRKLSSRPSAKGVYIYKGKKVVFGEW